jgi:hypothetical protein
VEVLRRDAGDGERKAIDFDDLADRRAVSVPATLPQRIADDD